MGYSILKILKTKLEFFEKLIWIFCSVGNFNLPNQEPCKYVYVEKKSWQQSSFLSKRMLSLVMGINFTVWGFLDSHMKYQICVRFQGDPLVITLKLGLELSCLNFGALMTLPKMHDSRQHIIQNRNWKRNLCALLDFLQEIQTA